jgi:hypothetical protein
MELEDKETYEAPTTLIVEVHSEGIVCASGGPFNGFHHQDGNNHEDYEW